MPRKLNLISALERFGLTVEYVPGWSTRGSTAFHPVGVMDHWTAGPRGTKSRPSLSVVTHGRKGLPGPLCNVYLDRRGVCVVVAAGRANHGGRGLWKGYSGNTKFYGIEAEAADGNDWTEAQRVAYPILNAALLWTLGQKSSSYACGHSEYALPRGRKIDINGYTMKLMRQQTQAMINGGPKAAKARIKAGGAAVKPSPVKPKPTPAKPKPKPKPAPVWDGLSEKETRSVQTYLKETTGDYTGIIDGKYQGMTVSAVKSYQKRQNRYGGFKLVVDGHWGPVMQKHHDWVKEVQAKTALWSASIRRGGMAPDGDYGHRTYVHVKATQSSNMKPGTGRYWKAGGRVADGLAGPIYCKMIGVRKHP